MNPRCSVQRGVGRGSWSLNVEALKLEGVSVRIELIHTGPATVTRIAQMTDRLI